MPGGLLLALFLFLLQFFFCVLGTVPEMDAASASAAMPLHASVYIACGTCGGANQAGPARLARNWRPFFPRPSRAFPDSLYVCLSLDLSL